MDIVSDTYIRGGIPQSRYCAPARIIKRFPAAASAATAAAARVCLYILDTGRRRGCEPGPGCDKHITLADWARSALGAAVLKDRRSRARSRKKAKP